MDHNTSANASELEIPTPEHELFHKNTEQSDSDPNPGYPGSSTRRNKRRRSFNKNSAGASNDVLQPTVQVILPPAEVKEELIDVDNCWDNSYPLGENASFTTEYEEGYPISQSDNEMHSEAASSSQVWGPVLFSLDFF